MSKKSSASYNKGTMKTLDAKALKARKDNLQAEFEREKAEALKCENVAKQAAEKGQKHLEKMAALQAAFGEIEKLEKSIGIDPLSTRPGGRAPGKRK